jgi:hypothetical protein
VGNRHTRRAVVQNFQVVPEEAGKIPCGLSFLVAPNVDAVEAVGNFADSEKLYVAVNRFQAASLAVIGNEVVCTAEKIEVECSVEQEYRLVVVGLVQEVVACVESL